MSLFYFLFEKIDIPFVRITSATAVFVHMSIVILSQTRCETKTNDLHIVLKHVKVYKDLVKQSVVADFFGRCVGTSVTLTGSPNPLGQGVSGPGGVPPGILGSFQASSVVLNVPQAREYDLIADFLDSDMLNLYSDILRSVKPRIQKGMTTKFGYFPMMDVAFSVFIMNNR